jgi:ABC-type cobalamin/Fe3+-siderophores transport system ATPase subunit
VLKTVHLKNFKLHKDTSIEAAPVTVFIGPNNSGKSTIFQALLALRQAASRQGNQFLQPVQRQPTSADQPYLFPQGEAADFGEFKDVVRHGENQIQAGVTGTIHPRKTSKYAAPVEVSFDLGVRDNRLAFHSGYLQSHFGRSFWNWTAGSPGQLPQASIQVDGIVLRFAAGEYFSLVGFTGHDNPPNVSPEKLADIRELGEYLGNAPVGLLNSLHPVFPLRGFEEWGYPLPDFSPRNLDRLTVSDRTIALAAILAYDRELEERLSKRLEELLQIGIKVHLVPPKKATIRATRLAGRNSNTLFTNEGTGANQLPFILVPIALASPNETILLSEPEAHLHPKAQSELTALLLTIAKKQNLQFFIETHSEHVLHRLLHSIGKGELAKEELALYYFVNEDGRAKVTRLVTNDLGQVDGGLPGFFEQSLAELTEYLDALRKP